MNHWPIMYKADIQTIWSLELYAVEMVLRKTFTDWFGCMKLNKMWWKKKNGLMTREQFYCHHCSIQLCAESNATASLLLIMHIHCIDKFDFIAFTLTFIFTCGVWGIVNPVYHNIFNGNTHLCIQPSWFLAFPYIINILKLYGNIDHM